MKTLKKLAAAFALVFVLSASILAGETNTPPSDPCALPGETNTPPCTPSNVISNGDPTLTDDGTLPTVYSVAVEAEDWVVASIVSIF